MNKIQFTGILPALVTPLDKKGRVKAETVKKLVDDQLAAGVDGFYVVGGTGEGVLLSVDQREAMAEAAVAANAGRGKVIVHTGSINSGEVMELTRHATKIGADGISSILPSVYFGYSMEETIDFYKQLAANTNLPVIVYANHTGNNIDINKMIDRLMAVENIAGAKDTRNHYFLMWQLKRLNGGNINVINGPDESLLCGLTMGADGGIGCNYNLMPELFVALYRKFLANDLAGAQAVQDRINRVISVTVGWSGGNIIRPVKASLRLSGYDVGSAVYPASDYSDEELKAFKRAMEEAGYVYSR